ncbi:uncharacterized protein LOC143181807 isoform X2 [Calliopsis andreniformis]|uniref:uncharacterized protein LOC143181807 isoform X2 n=1 Tax=Calliopsis andreniformis TaxID=337506 RepID=UPI003FCEE0B7
MAVRRRMFYLRTYVCPSTKSATRCIPSTLSTSKFRRHHMVSLFFFFFGVRATIVQLSVPFLSAPSLLRSIPRLCFTIILLNLICIRVLFQPIQQQVHQVPQHVPQQQQPQFQQAAGQQPVHQQVPVQQVPMQQQQHMPTARQVPVQQQQGHNHEHSQQILNAANIAHEKAHIAEHMEVPIDTSKMTDQELQFHYFKMHDADNNNKLDGCELIKSLIHWHGMRLFFFFFFSFFVDQFEQNLSARLLDRKRLIRFFHCPCTEQGNKETGGLNSGEKLFKDEELVTLIDPILSMDDANNDGYIDYPEFIQAQKNAAATTRQ